MTRKNLYLPLFFVIIIFVSAAVLFSQTSSFGQLTSSLHSFLKAELTDLRPLPEEEQAQVVYILGGPPKSLRRKFRVAGALYKQNMSDRIWILSVTGITKYSTKLERNLTYDEWAKERLDYYGVPASVVEPVTIQEGFLGTLSEGKGVAALLNQRDISKLLVISSPHHTRRVRLCFEHYMKKNQTLYIMASNENAPLRTLFQEYCKLKLYQLFLLIPGMAA